MLEVVNNNYHGLNYYVWNTNTFLYLHWDGTWGGSTITKGRYTGYWKNKRDAVRAAKRTGMQWKVVGEFAGVGSTLCSKTIK